MSEDTKRVISRSEWLNLETELLRLSRELDAYRQGVEAYHPEIHDIRAGERRTSKTPPLPDNVIDMMGRHLLKDWE